MSQDIGKARVSAAESDHGGGRLSTPKPDAGVDAPRPWWRRPWMIPLAAVLLWFLIYELPPYTTLDPGQARINVRENIPWHYPFLIGHITFGTIAQLTLFLQVWPWLRRRYPAVHRISGRLYVFGGALPSGLFCLAIVPFTPPSGRIGVAMAGVLWLTTTIVGYRMVRQRRFAEHRRWMLYSVAIVTGINYWGLAIVVVGQHLPVHVGITYLFEAARWFGWVINLFIVQWWLEHKPFTQRMLGRTGAAKKRISSSQPV